MARGVQLLWLSMSVLVVDANQFSPHLRKGSPWFEGWYTRITSTSSPGTSIGFIFGDFPDQAKSLKDPEAYAALLIQSPDATRPITVFAANPNVTKVTQSNGAPVTKNPDDESPPDLAFSSYLLPSLDPASRVASYLCTGDRQNFTFTFPGGVVLSGKLYDPLPWGPHGEGPEGWVSKLPLLGFDWFVYTLKSRVEYSLTVPSQGLRLQGSGFAHQEKNWGASFPDAWVWAQAIDATQDTLFALAGGPTNVLGPLTVTAYLIGLRTPKLKWNFHPQDPAVFSAQVDGKKGTLSLQATDASRMLNITISAPPGTFALVGCPTVTGFRAFSVESYAARATIEAYSRTTPLGPDHLIDTFYFSFAALEFGGSYI